MQINWNILIKHNFIFQENCKLSIDLFHILFLEITKKINTNIESETLNILIDINKFI